MVKERSALVWAKSQQLIRRANRLLVQNLTAAHFLMVSNRLLQNSLRRLMAKPWPAIQNGQEHGFGFQPAVTIGEPNEPPPRRREHVDDKSSRPIKPVPQPESLLLERLERRAGRKP